MTMTISLIGDAINQAKLHWEHRWSVGDTLMWDNRGGTMRTGRLDYPRDEARQFIRTTVVGQPIIPFTAGERAPPGTQN